MIINKPHLLTNLPIWFPKYSSAWTHTNERVALLSKEKVDHGTPMILVHFTKAKHLLNQRFAIARQEAVRFPIESNGKIDCYAVPMSAFSNWETPAEVASIAEMIFS